MSNCNGFSFQDAGWRNNADGFHFAIVRLAAHRQIPSRSSTTGAALLSLLLAHEGYFCGPKKQSAASGCLRRPRRRAKEPQLLRSGRFPLLSLVGLWSFLFVSPRKKLPLRLRQHSESEVRARCGPVQLKQKKKISVADGVCSLDSPRKRHPYVQQHDRETRDSTDLRSNRGCWCGPLVIGRLRYIPVNCRPARRYRR